MNYSATMESPIGPLLLTCSATGLTSLQMGARAEREHDHPLLQQTRRQLEEYFAGERTEFDLPLEPQGTEFQRAVWNQLCAIPFAETASYGQVAARVGRPKASRAVGAANGANPIAIIVPCHRVIGANGSLTGFGGGLQRKQWLLEHEREVAAMLEAASRTAG